MSLTKEEVIAKCIEREYDLNISSENWISFITNDRYRIGLQVWLDTGKFELFKYYGIFKISSDKRGSFMNDKHFDDIERDMTSYVRALNRVEDISRVE
jgi:hypothetical protein